MTEQRTNEQLLPTEGPPTFEKELEALINRWSKENASNTPDFILAGYLRQCLNAWNVCTQERDRWYSLDLRPGRRTGHGL